MSIESNARKFGELYSAHHLTGWQLGNLVARSCQLGQAGRPTKITTVNGISVNLDDGNCPPVADYRVSLNRFAELAGISSSNVAYYWHAWNLAAEDGLVQSAQSLDIDEDDPSIDDLIADGIDWSDYYQRAKSKRTQKNSAPVEEVESEDPPAKKPTKKSTKSKEPQQDNDGDVSVSFGDASDKLLQARDAIENGISLFSSIPTDQLKESDFAIVTEISRAIATFSFQLASVTMRLEEEAKLKGWSVHE